MFEIRDKLGPVVTAITLSGKNKPVSGMKSQHVSLVCG